MKIFELLNCKNKFKMLIFTALPFWFFSVLYYFSNIRTIFFKTAIFIFIISVILLSKFLLFLINKYLNHKIIKFILYLFSFSISCLLILTLLFLFINPVKNTIYTSPDGKNKIIVLTSYIFDQIYDIEAKPAINNFLYRNNNSSLMSIRHEGTGTPPVCVKWSDNSKTAYVNTCKPSNPEYDTEIIINF